MLTLSQVLLVVFHSKGSTVNWSLIGSDMPSALGLVPLTKTKTDILKMQFGPFCINLKITLNNLEESYSHDLNSDRKKFLTSAIALWPLWHIV